MRDEIRSTNFSRKWGALMKRRNALLTGAPPKWLRRLRNFSHSPNTSVLKEGCWVHAIYSTRFRKVYVGGTGGKDTPKQVIERYKEHLRATTGYGTLYGSRNICSILEQCCRALCACSFVEPRALCMLCR